MLRRKLKALGYIDWDKVDENDELHFRKVILWLEEQKIRFYKIEDRKDLRDVNSENWMLVYKKYREDIGCPISDDVLAEQLDWFLQYAICLEFDQNYKKYNPEVDANGNNNQEEGRMPNLNSANSNEKLNRDALAFKNGINSIAKVLNIPCHPNPLITMQACGKVISERLNPKTPENKNSVVEPVGNTSLKDIDCGVKSSDPVLERAMKGLHLLFINDLRNLQTKINETLVMIQNQTADPKTDTKLGKVGK